MIDSLHGPAVRVRINHDRTAAGWRCKETTVEVLIHLEAESDPNYLHHILQSELYAAHQTGLEEANRRNAQEGRE